MEENNLINHTKPISKEEAIEKLEKICEEFRMARSLVELLKYTADDESFRYGQGQILANVKDNEINYSLVFMQNRDWASLKVYDSPMNQIPDSGYINVFCSELAEFCVGPTKTGVWQYGKGDQKIYAISLRLHERIFFPSKGANWFFELMNWFSKRSYEFLLSSSEQPRFWEGNKERPD